MTVDLEGFMIMADLVGSSVSQLLDEQLEVGVHTWISELRSKGASGM
jgi:hypothetical protein